MFALNDIFKETTLVKVGGEIDIVHILLSSVTMAGVDTIQSMSEIKETKSTLIKKIVSNSQQKKWTESALKINGIFKNYRHKNDPKETEEAIDHLQQSILQLLFAMESNSSVLVLSGTNPIEKKHLLPDEIRIPSEILFSSIQTKSINLPVVKNEIERKDVKRIIEVLSSKEYITYRDAQSEIENNSNFTNKTVKLIETAGRDLYRKNLKTLDLKENIVKAVPLSSKVIDLFFGKFPGILTEYGATVLTDYLKVSKTIPIYNCSNVWRDIFSSRINKLKTAANNKQK